MNIEDTIYSRGFLSKEIDVYRAKYRNANSALFASCELLSNTATATLFGAELGYIEIHTLLAVAFWRRCLSTCQAALLLAERGMIPEAQILIRSASEFLFFGVASINDSSILLNLEAGHRNETLKMAREMLRQGVATQQLSEEQTSSLRTLIETTEQSPKGLSAYDAAEKAGLGYLYATIYRGLSLVASHATIAGTNAVFEENSDLTTSMVFGPSDDKMDFCLTLIQTCLENGIAKFQPILCRKTSDQSCSPIG